LTIAIIRKPVRVEELPGQTKAEITIAGSADPALENEGMNSTSRRHPSRSAANTPAGIFYG